LPTTHHRYTLTCGPWRKAAEMGAAH